MMVPILPMQMLLMTTKYQWRLMTRHQMLINLRSSPVLQMYKHLQKLHQINSVSHKIVILNAQGLLEH